ncbi:MAG TPA: hypothetical protein PKA41_18295 [Verrucomicrobiota bacterium]|nr:hypothetical protein [Verrucomicrobiota bacterium]
MSNPSHPQSEQKGRGCMFYGCLSVVVLFVMACVLGFVAFRWVKNEIATFTDPAPVELPRVQMDAAELRALQDNVATFGQRLADGKSSGPLTLTERELNALIAEVPELKQMSQTMYLSLTNKQLRAQLSVPLDHIAFLARGRYFNGEVTFNVSLNNGLLVVNADQAGVHGKRLPDAFMKKLRRENLAREIHRYPKTAEAIGKLESIEIQDGQLVINPRQAN